MWTVKRMQIGMKKKGNDFFRANITRSQLLGKYSNLSFYV